MGMRVSVPLRGMGLKDGNQVENFADFDGFRPLAG